MPAHRLRRWADINPALVQRPVFVGAGPRGFLPWLPLTSICPAVPHPPRGDSTLTSSRRHTPVSMTTS